MAKPKNNIQIMLTQAERLLQEQTRANRLNKLLESEWLQEVSESRNKWGIPMPPIEHPFWDCTRFGDLKPAQGDAQTPFIQSQVSYDNFQQTLFSHNQNATPDDDYVMVEENNIDDDYQLVESNKLKK
jgi:hypothetical protein